MVNIYANVSKKQRILCNFVRNVVKGLIWPQYDADK